MAMFRFYTGSDLDTITKELDRTFEELWGGNANGKNQQTAEYVNWSPVVNVAETENQFEVTMELPGVRREDIKIEFEKGVLRINGERLGQEIAEGTKLLHSERMFGKFTRSFSIKTPVNTDQISATFKDGILTLTLPKAEEAKAKSIEIK